MPILGGFALETADFRVNFSIVRRWPVLQMFNFHRLTHSADWNQPTLSIGRWPIGQVGMGLNSTVNIVTLKVNNIN